MCSINLWGDFREIENEKTPIHILKEQADLLSKMTNRVLTARITRDFSYQEYVKKMRNKGEEISYDSKSTLDIVAPSINDYSVTILELLYNTSNVDFYPVEVNDLISHKEYSNIVDEEDFIASLGKILSSSGVQKVINSLLIHVKAI
jgi:hypothetical protein